MMNALLDSGDSEDSGTSEDIGDSKDSESGES